MEQASVSPKVQYIVTDDGQRTAVVLRWEDYQALRAKVSTDPDLLVGLGEAELEALAEGVLSLRHQAQLNELIERNRRGDLSEAEQRELDQLLARVDSMNTLKARALYTLRQLGDMKRE